MAVGRAIRVLALVLLVAVPAWAAKLTDKQISAMTPDQVDALPAVDFVLTIADRATPKDVRADIELSLRTLGFYQGWPDGADRPAYHRAVKRFQSAEGQPATGRLTVKEAAELARRINLFAYGGLETSLRSITVHEGSLYANGTWLERGSKFPAMFNYSEIVCGAGQQTCEETSVRIDSGMLMLWKWTWKIKERSEARVVAETLQGRCVAATLTIDAAAQTASRTRHSSGEANCHIEPGDVAEYDLANGQTLGEEMRADAQKARDDALDPAYRDMVLKLRNGPVWAVLRGLAMMTEK